MERPQPFIVKCQGKRSEFTMAFDLQEEAEHFARSVSRKEEGFEEYELLDYNFFAKFTDEELDDWKARRIRFNEESARLQKQCLDRTNQNFRNPDLFPCEICGGKHENFNCCQSCNWNEHRCMFCGDDLGHKEVSACYMAVN